MYTLLLIATAIPAISALRWGHWYDESSPICVGTKCPSANPFTYSYCCGTLLNDCCIWIQVGFLKPELY
ncbi:hypothetical protein WR25_01425 [Diploscapter pachys]|uniref:WAP domain-containing protein n=1 Tax=Diploscapter pachys TaxID=2018661 RepID=A0A2A2JP95_9BILA|nr:hypothetical protein WR25_01425 [Diploscapter pachys]